LARLIAIDPRNLAVLRMGLAIIILVDLAGRFGSVATFLSDEGVIDRVSSRWLCPPSQGFWSLYWLSGSTAWATVLLIVNALAAVLLLFGWRTKLATVLCLVLAYSLQMRMPLVLTAGHILLRMLLFWSLFLPLGAVWSVDARRSAARRDPRQIATIATAAIMIQLTLMYLCSGIAKWNEVWLRGDALGLAMRLDMYVKPLGRELGDWPQFLMLFTFLTLVLETAGPLLLWMPVKSDQWRLGLMAMFWLLHIGIGLTMSIGIFSAVAMLAWVVFWPELVWRTLSGWRPPRAAAAPDDAPRFASTLGWLPSCACGGFLIYVIALNLANVDPARSGRWFGQGLRTIGNSTMTLQQFTMFDRPSEMNWWWRLVVQTAEGGQSDALSPTRQPLGSLGQRPTPAAIYDSIPSHFWRRLLYNLATWSPANAADRAELERIKQRAGRALWGLRDSTAAPSAAERVELFACWHKIRLDDVDSPVQWESWGSLDSPSAR
jgi:hypothetical protein